MKKPLIVNIAPIRGKFGAREEVECSAVLEDLETSDSHVPEGDEVSFIGTLETIDGGIVAEGMVQARWVGECRRCLGPAGDEIHTKVREVFEVNPTEGETYGLDGDCADLEPLVRESIMLELPLAPLCRPDCKGLCPNCGTNWNQSRCDCSQDSSDPRWAALDALKDK